MKKGNFIPKTSIDEFRKMDDYFITSIISDIENNPKVKRTIAPLDFLNHFYEQLEIIELNIDNYIGLTNHLFELQLHKNEKLNKYILLYFIRYLVSISTLKFSLSMKEKFYKEGLPMFYFIITELLEKKKEELNPEAPSVKPNPNKNLYKFNTIKKELEYFNNNIEKLLYLQEVKTNFLQKYPVIEQGFPNPFFDIDFDEKCDLEIKKLNELIEIENIQNIEKAKPQKSKEKPGRKSPETKPLKEYFINLQKDRIPVFIEALKEGFINSTPKEFTYMLKTLENSKNLMYGTPKEIFDAFEIEFGKEYGVPESKYKQLRIMNLGGDKELMQRIKNKIEHIKQSCLIV